MNVYMLLFKSVLKFKQIHDPRVEYILSYCCAFSLIFSFMYFGLLLWGYWYFDKQYTEISLATGTVILLLFITAYIANYKKYTDLSLIILTTTILTICTLSGVLWGFDLPSVLLGYIFSIVITTIVGTNKQNKIHLIALISMLYIGYLYREYAHITKTWHTESFKFNDIIEMSAMFLIITALLIFSQRIQSNLLKRAKRTEYLLKQEKDSLEIRIKNKIEEIKLAQIENLSVLYRFVEFGKISSGLFHDLMSPIQTLKIYLESFPYKELNKGPVLQFKKIQSVSNKIENMLETMRRQIRFNQTVEVFDALQEISDILLITKHLYVKKNILIQIKCNTKKHILKTKRVIFNHVILNLISNACEACNKEKEEQFVTIHVGILKDSAYSSYISIVDSGKGISKDNMSKIFDNFYSTKNRNQERHQHNCGIGLSSSKYAVVHHLNGKILVESEENIGTTVTVLI